MKHALTMAVALVLAAGPVRAEGPAGWGRCDAAITAPAAVTASLDAVLSRVVEGTELGAAPGAVLLVEAPGWRYQRAIGLADPQTGEPVDCEMPFEIGSATKMMTAAVLMQLHEEGRLSVDDPLARHLPEIAARLPYGQEMTLRQLAQHVAGVFSYTDTAPDGTPGVAVASMGDAAARRRFVSPEEMVAFTLDHGAPLFAPGEAGKWAYSNSGYALLGLVIERVEGLPLDKVFENRVFGPLGMTRSYLWNDSPRPDFGLPRSFLMPPFEMETTDWNLSQAWAGGGVISTPADMQRFISALVEGRLFRKPGTLALMQETVPSPIPGTEGYGLGLIRLNGSFWGHGGQTLGYIAAVGGSAPEGLTFVAWGNSAGNPVAMIGPDILAALRQAGALTP